VATGRLDAPQAAQKTEAAFQRLRQGGHPNDLSSDSILYSIIRKRWNVWDRAESWR